MFCVNNKCQTTTTPIAIRHFGLKMQSNIGISGYSSSAGFSNRTSSITRRNTNEVRLKGFATSVFIRLKGFTRSLSIFFWYLL